MKINLKHFIICVLFVFITISGNGCAINQDDIAGKMLNYMNSKYDDTFTFNAPYGGSLGSTSHQMTVKSKKYPDCEIWVQYYEENGKETFADNYVDYKFKKQTCDRLININKDIFDTDVIVSYTIPSRGSVNAYDDNTEFEEYIKGKEHPISFTAVISPEFITDDKDKTVSYLKECFKNYDMNIMATYRFSKSETNFKNIKANPSTKIEDFERLVITIIDDEVITCEWN